MPQENSSDEQSSNINPETEKVFDPQVSGADSKENPILDEMAKEESGDDLADKAVDEIVKNEADVALKQQDEEVAKAFTQPKTIKEKLLSAFHYIWDEPKRRYMTIAGVVVFLILLFAIPFTRYGLINLVGVRSSAEIIVVDSESQLPLKNANITIGDKSALTNDEGLAVVEGLKLGSKKVNIKKIAYEDATQDITVGISAARLDNVGLNPVGTRIDFQVMDWLSESPLGKAEASIGESSALSDEQGFISLVVPPSDDEITVKVGAENYKDQDVVIDSQPEEAQKVSLVLSEKNYFVSKRSGNYDVYSVDFDGENESKIIQGTGNERSDIKFTVSPSRERAVLISSRDGIRNENGYLMQSLHNINLKDSTLESIDESEQIDPIGWIKDSLIYVKIKAGASGRNPQRQRLMSFNTVSGQQTELAASNYFHDVMVVDDQVLYAPSDLYKQDPKSYLYRIDASGENRTVIMRKTVWTMVRQDHTNIDFDAEGDWYSMSIGQYEPTALSGTPNNRISRLYVDRGERSLWVDNRDGKGVLIMLNTATGEEETLLSLAGLKHPVSWISDEHVVFRVNTGQETADYVVNVNGGDPVKVTDVSNTGNNSRWSYYY